jgi:nitroreductase
MCRSFTGEPLPAGLVDELCDLARRAPSAGNTQAASFLVLEGADVAAYWDVTLPAGSRRQGFAFPGLLRAPTLVLPTVRPSAYVERYAEPDKASTGLGRSLRAWSVPYWWVDAGMGVYVLLLAARARGLGVALFGVFDHEASVKERFGIPEEERLLGCIALGRPDEDERPGRSAGRSRRPLDEVVHRGHW